MNSDLLKSVCLVQDSACWILPDSAFSMRLNSDYPEPWGQDAALGKGAAAPTPADGAPPADKVGIGTIRFC